MIMAFIEMNNIPSGTVTFLFTDVEGSTVLAQSNQELLNSALSWHNEILSKSFQFYSGFIFRTVGDAFCCAFANASEAVSAAVEAQRKLCAVNWGEAIVKVRMGIHTGNAEWSGENYMGYVTLARSNRVMSAAHGGQIIISEHAFNNLETQKPENISYRDLGARRLKDLISPMKLYQVISDGIPSNFPPIKSLDERPNNLPLQLTGFIGRERELNGLKDLFARTRLLTLHGPGGTGKTRLALQAASDFIDDFQHGVWFIDFAPVSDPLMIPETAAISVMTDFRPGEDISRALLEHLREKKTLLIFDNCEHLVLHISQLCTLLLKNCSGLKIISTSREMLKCDGEQIMSIAPLLYPSANSVHSPEELVKFEAVRLFIERALLVDKNFRVNRQNTASVAGICECLEGIPLAIELAASRLKAMSPERLLERLDNRFSILTGGSRNVLPRQQTLKAMLDWSYDLLSEESKLLWKRTSVFIDGFTLDAAEDVCSDGRLERSEIAEILFDLNEKSIVSYDITKDRYKMLETIRQHGRSKIETDSELELLNNRHLMYYVGMAERYSRELRGKSQAKVLNLFTEEYANLQAALGWSLSGNHGNEAARIAIHLSRFWNIRGYAQSADMWLQKIIALRETISADILAQVLNSAGDFHQYTGDHEGAIELLEQSIELNRNLGDKKWTSSSLNSLGALHAKHGEYSKASVLLAESLKIRREMDDKPGMLGALCNLCQLSIMLSDFRIAGEYAEEALEISREYGDSYYIYLSERNAGQLAALRGDLPVAIAYYERALAYNKEIGYRLGISFILTELAEIYIEMGEFDSASELLRQSEEAAEDQDDKLCAAMICNAFGNLKFKTGNHEDAERYFSRGLELFRLIGGNDGIAISLSGLGSCSFARGDMAEAGRLLTESLDLLKQINFKKEIPGVMLRISEIESALGNSGHALALAEEAMEMAKSIGINLTESNLQRYKQIRKS